VKNDSALDFNSNIDRKRAAVDGVQRRVWRLWDLVRLCHAARLGKLLRLQRKRMQGSSRNSRRGNRGGNRGAERRSELLGRRVKGELARIGVERQRFAGSRAGSSARTLKDDEECTT